MCTLAGCSLTKKSSIVLYDTFKVNILLVSPDKKWITAGSAENNDLCPKVFFINCLQQLCSGPFITLPLC